MELISVIKYEGDNQTFVWKHPTEDFNTGSQLIVHESQVAIFFLNGQALDTFGPGRYELTTQNLPLVNKLVNLPSNGASPFHAEIYFINLVEQMGIPWGTNSKIQFMEPQFGFPLSIGACGELALAVREPRKLLLKIVGTEAVLSQERFVHYFKAFLQTRIKAVFANAITEQKLSIFEMDAHLEEFSAAVKSRLAPDFAGYGLELTQMLVTTVLKPDGDPVYERFKLLHFRQYADVKEAQINQQVGIINQETEAKQTIIAAQAAAQKRSIEGYTYQQERGFDVAEHMAQNEAVGEFANMGIGLGMMTGVGGPMGQVVGGAVSQAINSVDGMDRTAAVASGSTTNSASSAPATNDNAPATADSTQAKFCSECGHQFQGTEKFCPECGTRRS